MKKQVVIFIHGIGTTKSGYSTKTQEILLKNMSSHGINISNNYFIFKELLWSHHSSTQELELWNRLQNDTTSYGKKMDYHFLRKLFLLFIGDSFLYDEKSNIQNDIFTGLFKLIKEAQEEAINDGYDYEITFVAHSLGTIILSDFLNEAKRKNHFFNNKIVNVFTFGSPLAIWSLKADLVSKVRPNIFYNKDIGTWTNILDDDDIIAYPLKPINKDFENCIDIDYITEIGKTYKPGVIFSHVSYWTDLNSLLPISKKLVMDYKRIYQDEEYNKETYHSFVKGLFNI